MDTKTNNTEDREINISRLLDAPVELVWEVWTQAEHLAKWWGPAGYSNTIADMDVRPEGVWNLVMHGPDGVDYPSKHVYKEVIPMQKIVYEHVYTPQFTATITFEAQGDKTMLRWHMLFASKAEFEEVVRTHKADQGLAQNVDKLNLYMQTQQHIRKQLKTNKMARVSTYLNFPGNTEAAFKFYQTVFGGEFTGGIQRFDSAPVPEGAPALSEEDKQLILHIELPIIGGHVLMATDAPASMGFTVTTGNNMHINLELDSKEETKRLYEALAEGGKVTMELQNMFWGAYFGSCVDKYGVSWMLNCTA